MLLFATAFIVATLGRMTDAQYFNRPYQMAIHNGFSPYHPARINHETLPISQAEFAQLVAESMATSHGPHHHHPPNTDADYDGPDHAARDAEMLRSASGDNHYGSYQPNHNHHHHSQHQRQHHHHHGVHSQYQPEDHYHNDNDESYHRSPVYDQSRSPQQEQYQQEVHQQHPHHQQQQQQQQQQEDEEEDEETENDVDTYGGRPADYQPGYESQTRNAYINNYEEDQPRDQYMSASEQIPIKIIPLKHA